MVRQKRYKSQGRGVRGLAGTTDRVRDGGKGQTNNELGRLGSTRSKMPKVKTQSLLAVVKSNERSNKVMNSIRRDSEDAIANDLLGIGVEVSRYTLTCIGGENSHFNPSFWDLGRSSAVERREARLAASRRIDFWVTQRHRRRESGKSEEGWTERTSISVVWGMFCARHRIESECFDVHHLVVGNILSSGGFFFLDNAALVVTTVAVMKIC